MRRGRERGMVLKKDPSNLLDGIEREKISWFRSIVLSWYSQNGRQFPWREETANSYQKILAEVLLQRTKAQTVAKHFPALVKRYPSWINLSNAAEEELEDYLKPLGLWRRRIVSVKALAYEMAQRKGQFPKVREEIESLPGVGQYIANAILLFCHDDARPLLDENMARVLERFFGPRKLADIRYDPYLQNLAAEVVKGRESILVNWAILDFASLVCNRTSAQHTDCPLCKECNFMENCT